MRPRVSLPEPTTSFFGRDAELDAIRASFAGGRRLVSVLGPGGVGKTRLALQLARLVELERAVVFCDLTEAASLGELCSTLSRALGTVLGSTDGESALSHLARTLGTRGPTLLVLDNLEQLVACAAPAVAELLAGAADLRILATSRIRLRATGEAVFDLEPLAVPAPGDADPERFPAVQLFVERARRIAPGWGDAPGDPVVVADIVRRLEGFPLAIELCATRGRVLDPASLLGRLERGLDALGAAPRDAAERHSTLSHAIEWSVRSLPAADRSAFEQCSVFSGGFSLEAAEAVVELDGSVPLLDALSNLVDASLLRAAGGRFSMYSVVREHAARALAETDRAGAAEARHARYFVELGERVLATAPDAERGALMLEQGNLAAALARSRDALALRAALVLDDLLEISGTFTGAFDRIDPVLRAAEEIGAPPALIARGLWARGRAQLIGRTADAARDEERAVAIASEIGERATEARACATLCVTYRVLRRIDEARAMGERAVEICKTISAPRIEARARNALGGLLYEIGERERARVLLEEAERIAREVGDRWVEAWALGGRAHLLHEGGELEEAANTFERAATLFRAIGGDRDAEVCTGYRAAVIHEQGNCATAHTAYVAIADRLGQLGNPRFEGLFRACAGAAAAAIGKLDAARTALDDADRILGRLGDPALVLVVQLHRLHLEIAEHRTSEAIATSRALTEKSPLVAASDDVRLALRLVHAAIASAPRGSGAALRLAIGARWFEPPGGKRTQLGRKRALWLLLHALADARLRAPGRVLASDELVAAGWPDERILPTAGAHRVRVSVATLRNLGLRGILLSRDGGYLLDPAVPVEIAI